MTPEDIQTLSQADLEERLKELAEKQEREEATQQEIEKRSLFAQEAIRREIIDNGMEVEEYDEEELYQDQLYEAQLKDFDKLVVASSSKFKELNGVKLKIAYSGVPLGLEGIIINVWEPNFERYIEEKVLMYKYTVQIYTELVVVDEDEIEEI